MTFDRIAALRERLLAWYRANKRDLPWRRTRDPYAIWLSEVMLQQTRVETVVPYWARFVRDYPTVHDLAEAPLDDVLAKWSGLGYYRRARALHEAARQIAVERDGIFPRAATELRTIKGIGPYTAGAVASIAFDEPAPVVDGNVLRVYARIFEVEDDLRSAKGVQKIWSIASEVIPSKNAGDFNQALMELGATICTPKSPRCLLCPVRELCAASAHGREETLPHLAPKKAPKEWRRVALVVTDGDRVLVARRRGDALFGGMWEPPAVDDDEGTDERPRALAKLVRLQRGASCTEMEPVQHVLSHRKMTLRVLALEAKSAHLTPNDEYEEAAWMTAAELDRVGVSTLARKVLAAGAAGLSASGRARRGRPKRSS